MNSLLTTPDPLRSCIMHTVIRGARAVCMFSAVVMFAPCGFAQADAPNEAPPAVEQPEPDLYSMKFDGHDVRSLEEKLKAEFPSDNVVVTRQPSL